MLAPIFAALLVALLAALAALTIWVLNTLFLTGIPYSVQTIIAAALLNLIAAWLGAGPWFIIGLTKK